MLNIASPIIRWTIFHDVLNTDIYYTYQGQVASRLGKRLLYPWGIFECQDGLMFLAVAEEDQWQRLLRVPRPFV